MLKEWVSRSDVRRQFASFAGMVPAMVEIGMIPGFRLQIRSVTVDYVQADSGRPLEEPIGAGRHGRRDMEVLPLSQANLITKKESPKCSAWDKALHGGRSCRNRYCGD